MYEKQMLEERSFRNVAKNGAVTGFQVGVRVTHYHGVPLAIVKGFKVVVDGVEYPRTAMHFSLKGQTFTLDEMNARMDVYWEFGEVAILTVDCPGGLKQGSHEIAFSETLNAYGRGDTEHRFVFTFNLGSMIRRGVTLYSYQQEYYTGDMTLEDMVREVSELDTDGIEILAEATVKNYPNPSDFFIGRWFEILEKYRCKPIAYDASFGYIPGNEAAAAKLKTDIDIAARMGFSIIRAQNNLETLKMCLKYAGDKGITLAQEIHSPNYLGSPEVEELFEYAYKNNIDNLGLIPDMGIFCKNPVRLCYEKHLRQGATPELVDYVCQAYMENRDMDETIAYVREHGGNALDLFWAKEAFDYIYCDAALLAKYAAHIPSIHGKFYEMTNAGEEYSIPYQEAIAILKECSWSGYICSEFEGQRHYHDLRYFDINSVDEVKRHHRMMQKYIDM